MNKSIQKSIAAAMRKTTARGMAGLHAHIFNKNASLRLRLSFFFTLLLFGAWLVAALVSWRISVANIDTFFDTQQMLFAKRLATAGSTPLPYQLPNQLSGQFLSQSSTNNLPSHAPTTPEHLPDTSIILHAAGSGDEGEQEDDALAFAVFSSQGHLLLSDGEEGKIFPFSPDANGFINTRIHGDVWRILWLTSLDGRIVVAVGQEMEYREEMALDLIWGQMLPWLFLLPVLLVGLTWMLGRELAPLWAVSRKLGERDPHDTTPLDMEVPSEIAPLVASLNNLFARIGTMLHRERAFIADAAHELRTPLAGLGIQVQVAQRTTQPEKRNHALAQLRRGINRTSRLVDQLLTLFRLESQPERFAAGEAHAGIHSWASLLEAALEEYQGQITDKNIRLTIEDKSDGAIFVGNSELAAIMLGNIVSNAVKYTPQNGTINFGITSQTFTAQNSSRDISAADATRLGERFFRPPGQTEPGSGLGLSIIKRIADMYGLTMHIHPKAEQFTITLEFEK